MKSDNILQIKSYDFALTVVNTYRFLCEEKKRICFKQTTFTLWNFCWSKC